MDPDSKQPSFLKYLKNSMIRENYNYLAVMIKTCIENSFDDKIKQGKSRPYAAKPPVATYQQLREKLILSNLEKLNFDVDESIRLLKLIGIPYASMGKDNVDLTLEFSASHIPEIIKICNKEIEMK
jgi:hypothetical protein